MKTHARRTRRKQGLAARMPARVNATTDTSRQRIREALQSGPTPAREGPQELFTPADINQSLARGGPEQEWVTSTATPTDPMAAVFREYADRLRQGGQRGAFDLFMPDVTDEERRSFSVPAYFFPGRRRDLRALVVGGIHGNEPQGAEIAERLRARLQQDCAAGNPPLYTTIVVPVLFRRTHLAPFTDRSGQRLRRGRRFIDIGDTAFPEGIEPNRNFPLESESYADARRRVQQGLPELVDPERHTRAASDTHVTSRILPENRALIRLIEQFRPHRLITLHAHSVLPDGSAPEGRVQSRGRGRGDLPGIFVDPRGGFDPATDTARTAEGRADDALTSRLLATTRAGATGTWPTDPFQGNVATTWPTDIVGGAPYTPQAGTPTVHYTSTAHERGTSLGMWASAHGITTLTIEVPQWSTTAEREPLDRLMNVYRDALVSDVLNRE